MKHSLFALVAFLALAVPSLAQDATFTFTTTDGTGLSGTYYLWFDNGSTDEGRWEAVINGVPISDPKMRFKIGNGDIALQNQVGDPAGSMEGAGPAIGSNGGRTGNLNDNSGNAYGTWTHVAP